MQPKYKDKVSIKNFRGDYMKHVYMVDDNDGSTLKVKVDDWILENEKNLEVVDIECSQMGGLYISIITYEERK